MAQPEMMEVQTFHVDAVLAERVDIPLAHPAPVHELDAELERRMGLAHEGVFIEAQQAVEIQNVRDGGLTHANRADRVRLDHLDADVRAFQESREAGGRHPPGRAAADDHDVANAQVAHCALPDGQYRRRNSSCVGIAFAAASIASRMDSRLSCTMA